MNLSPIRPETTSGPPGLQQEVPGRLPGTGWET